MSIAYQDTINNETVRPMVPHGGSVVGLQVDVTGVATVEIKTRLVGASAYNSQSNANNSTVLLNMVDVEQVELVATGGSGVVTISTVDK